MRPNYLDASNRTEESQPSAGGNGPPPKQLSLDRIIIRYIRESDLPALEWEGTYRHHRLLFRSAYQEMQRGQKLLLVAEVDRALIGQIFVQLQSAEPRFADGVTRGYLHSLRVRPAWRHRGVGTRLIACAEDELRARGFTQAIIAVAKDNAAALHLYQCLGYHIFGDDPGRWSYTDADGRQQEVCEPSWLLEKQLV